MAIQIAPYLTEHEGAVRHFNRRLAPTGFGFSESCSSRWLPPHGSLPRQDYFVALDEQQDVRGAYILKYQDFVVCGEQKRIADFQFPLSEGLVDRRYALLGIQLYQHAADQSSRLFGLGVGDLEQPIAKLFQTFRWSWVPVPFFFRVLNATAFLRNIGPLRRSTSRRWLLDSLAATRAGSAGIHLIQATRPCLQLPKNIHYECVDSFDTWADDLWQQHASAYRLCAVRDQQVLNRLYPTVRTNFGRGQEVAGQFIRIRVDNGSRCIGWAVALASTMNSHKQFGDMRVGTIVDAFATPENAKWVVAAARDVLRQDAVDLIVSNQMHSAWQMALRHSGFLSAPSNFIFFASPRLAADVEPFHQRSNEFHLNRGDGDGPINL